MEKSGFEVVFESRSVGSKLENYMSKLGIVFLCSGEVISKDYFF